MGLFSKLRFRRGAGKARRTDRAAMRLRRCEQFERSHDYRKLAVTEANKNGMGFNGL
jgi:hypothetical protein